MSYLQKIIIKSFYLLLFFQFGVSFASEAEAVATFHSMSLYWSPTGGSTDKDIIVKYKKSSEAVWREALPMRYRPIGVEVVVNAEDVKADYRGSVVNLLPNTEYIFKLTLESTNNTVYITESTWNESFNVTEEVNVSARNTTYTISTGGNNNNYKVYNGNGATIDVEHNENACIYINANYVIVKNFVLKGAGSGEGYWPPIGAITIADGVHNVVIEDCNISDFGRRDIADDFDVDSLAQHGYNMDSGILFAPNDSPQNIKHIIIQRNKIHHPTYDCNTWYEPYAFRHSEGPQGISMWNTKGQTVIRYNEFYSDMDHMFNDIIGGGSNDTLIGSPGSDSDIYGNYISHTWDDAIEVEGGGQNVRIWNNYITHFALAISNAPVTIGPLYIWKNVSFLSMWNPNDDYPRGTFIKMGNAGKDEYGIGYRQTGHMYIFNNTIYQGNYDGCAVGIGGSSEDYTDTNGVHNYEVHDSGRITKHCTTRNNILEVKDTEAPSISYHGSNSDNDFDYDLFDGKISSNYKTHGKRIGVDGNLVYVPNAGLDEVTKKGNFQIETTSLGYDSGKIIHNFTDGYEGIAPDMGAYEHGSSDLEYGVGANFVPPVVLPTNHELLSDNYFNENDWILNGTDEGYGEFEIDNSGVLEGLNSAKITVTTNVDSDWKLELHNSINGGIESGEDYIIEFTAKTNLETNISCLVREWEGNYDATNLGTVVLTTDSKLYTITFHPTESISVCHFTFGLSEINPNTVIWIDDVHMNIVDTLNAVPVELTSFEAILNENMVTLRWATATEVNNYGFGVERRYRKEGEWEKVSFVEGSGNSNSQKNYEYVDNIMSFGKYNYRLKQIDTDGTFEYSQVIEVNFGLPKEYSLGQNYPNPFNPTTTINFSLPKSCITKLEVYNLLGEKVKTIVNERLEAGAYHLKFNGNNLTSGIYFYRLQSDSYQKVKKMLLLK